MAENTFMKVESFNGTQEEWDMWSAQALLKDYGVVYAEEIDYEEMSSEENISWDKLNKKAYYALILACKDKVSFNLIKFSKSIKYPRGDAELAWSRLVEKYEPTDGKTKIELKEDEWMTDLLTTNLKKQIKEGVNTKKEDWLKHELKKITKRKSTERLILQGYFECAKTSDGQSKKRVTTDAKSDSDLMCTKITLTVIESVIEEKVIIRSIADILGKGKRETNDVNILEKLLSQKDHQKNYTAFHRWREKMVNMRKNTDNSEELKENYSEFKLEELKDTDSKSTEKYYAKLQQEEKENNWKNPKEGLEENHDAKECEINKNQERKKSRLKRLK